MEKELLAYLNRLVPERCPTLTETERDIYFYVGKRALVKHLQQLYEIQQNNPNANDTIRIKLHGGE